MEHQHSPAKQPKKVSESSQGSSKRSLQRSVPRSESKNSRRRSSAAKKPALVKHSELDPPGFTPEDEKILARIYDKFVNAQGRWTVLFDRFIEERPALAQSFNVSAGFKEGSDFGAFVRCEMFAVLLVARNSALFEDHHFLKDFVRRHDLKGPIAAQYFERLTTPRRVRPSVDPRLSGADEEALHKIREQKTPLRGDEPHSAGKLRESSVGSAKKGRPIEQSSPAAGSKPPSARSKRSASSRKRQKSSHKRNESVAALASDAQLRSPQSGQPAVQPEEGRPAYSITKDATFQPLQSSSKALTPTQAHKSAQREKEEGLPQSNKASQEHLLSASREAEKSHSAFKLIPFPKQVAQGAELQQATSTTHSHKKVDSPQAGEPQPSATKEPKVTPQRLRVKPLTAILRSAGSPHPRISVPPPQRSASQQKLRRVNTGGSEYVLVYRVITTAAEKNRKPRNVICAVALGSEEAKKSIKDIEDATTMALNMLAKNSDFDVQSDETAERLRPFTSKIASLRVRLQSKSQRSTVSR